MKYYAKQIENGEIIALHTMDRPFPTVEGFVPITETEYTELIAGWEATPRTRTSGRTGIYNVRRTCIRNTGRGEQH